MSFTIPKEDKEFWGNEFLTPKGHLTLDSAIYRIQLYVAQYNLKTDQDEVFLTDEIICKVLGTNQRRLSYTSLSSLLAEKMNQPSS